MSQKTPQTNPRDLLTFHRQLAHWYGTHGRRELPWRNTTDPYAIWVSEVMLQQTQVSTVLARYYFPFLKKFPSITHLAKASKQDVLKAWEGLGYYRRAGFLHEAAKTAVEGGLNPLRADALTPAASGSRNYGATQLLDDLLALPGIGQNTAHAILAFAHHQPVPVLEANVKRVVARIFARETPKEPDLWELAYALMGVTNTLSEPSSRSGHAQRGSVAALHDRSENGRDKEIGQRKCFAFDYNQAMMDLGAMVCTPKTPKCNECPASIICKGKAAPERYPARKAKKTVPTKHVTITVMEDVDGRLFLEARQDALLGGLYGFPQSPLPTPLPQAGEGTSGLAAEARRAKAEARGEGELIGQVTHIYTHFRLEGTVRHLKLNQKKCGTDWHTRGEIAALPLSKLDHKILALVDNHHSATKKNHKNTRPRRLAA